MSFIEDIYEKLRRHPKRVVFPDGADPRVIQAARKFVDLKLGAPILLGNKDAIRAEAKSLGTDLHHVMVINPESAADLEFFTRNLERLERYRKMNLIHSREIMVKPNYFASMMLQFGQADALVGGAGGYAGSLLRPLLQVIKPLPGTRTVTSCQILITDKTEFGSNGVLFLADCGVIPTPTIEQLSAIAVKAGAAAQLLTGQRARVAMLSFSTKGSARTPETEKMVAATALAQQRAKEEGLDFDIDGELQADAALLPDLAQVKVPGSQVAGRANVLIFPDLNSGNIASKMAQHLSGAQALGQLLLGLSKPAVDLSRATTVDEIVQLSAIAALQAIEYRKLYPVEEEA